MKITRRAFSLLEAVFTLFIVFLLLGLCGDLFKQYSNSMRFSDVKTNSLTSTQNALQMMLDDARQATRFNTPGAVGGPGSATLDFFTVNPRLLNANVANATTDNIRIKYYLSDGSTYPAGSLLRDSTPAGGATTTFKVADSIQGLNVVGVASWSTVLDSGLNAIRIQLSIQDTSGITVVSGSSMRPPF